MDLSGRMVDTIVVQEPTGSGTRGQPTWGAQVSAPAIVNPRERMVRNADGDLVQTSHVLLTYQPITFQSRVWLPGANPANEVEARRPVMVTSQRSLADDTLLYRAEF